MKNDSKLIENEQFPESLFGMYAQQPVYRIITLLRYECLPVGSPPTVA